MPLRAHGVRTIELGVVRPFNQERIPQAKEERFVLHDRAAQASGELMIVGPIRDGRFPCASFRIDLPVVVPGIRVEGAVADSPHSGAMELVRTGPRQELNLSVAAAELCIDGRDNDASFTDQIGA